jgi:hypothetical protein
MSRQGIAFDYNSPAERSRPGWWCNSAEQAASERALDSAVASERLAVVIANHR